jgi:hypothetical protein
MKLVTAPGYQCCCPAPLTRHANGEGPISAPHRPTSQQSSPLHLYSTSICCIYTNTFLSLPSNKHTRQSQLHYTTLQFSLHGAAGFLKGTSQICNVVKAQAVRGWSPLSFLRFSSHFDGAGGFSLEDVGSNTCWRHVGVRRVSFCKKNLGLCECLRGWNGTPT